MNDLEIAKSDSPASEAHRKQDKIDHYIVTPVEPDMKEALCSCGDRITSGKEWLRHLGWIK